MRLYDVNEQLVYDLALRSVLAGGFNATYSIKQGQKGRPRHEISVDGTVLKKNEFDLYEKLVDFGKKCRAVDEDGLMSPEEITAHIRDSVPKIMKRMVDMALVTDDLKAIKAVHTDLMDRGYGKAAEKIDMTISNKDVRNAWKQIEQRQVKVIDVSVIEQEDEVNEDN